jgi:hypothetical protein
MPRSSFDSVLKDIRSALEDPALTPEGRVCAMVREIERLEVPAERVETLRAELRGLEALIRDQPAKSAAQSVLVREAGEFYQRATALARPIPPTRPADEVRRCFGGLQELGWASPTIDLLETELKTGEHIVRYDADSITTDRQRIERKALIEKHRPRAMTPDHFAAWERQHMRNEALQTPVPRRD